MCAKFTYPYVPKYPLCTNIFSIWSGLGSEGGGGYSDIFIHTLARTIFGGSKYWISIFWGGFMGMKILWILFLCHHKIVLVFLRSGTEFGYFWGLLKFQYFSGVVDIPDIFWCVNGRCWVQANLWRKTESTPPPPPPRLVHCFYQGIIPKWNLHGAAFHHDLHCLPM